MQFKIQLLLALLFVSSKIVAQQYYPSSEWQIKKPEELGMNKKKLDSAVKVALQNENAVDRDLRVAILKSYANEPDFKILGPTKQRGASTGVIIKSGYIVAQWGDVNRVDMTFSATKSMLSSVAGLAVDQTLIKNITDKVNNYVVDETFVGDHNSKITWEQLLNQSSDWSGCQFGICDWADRPPKEGGIDDWKNRKLIEPGTVFEYNDVRVNLLAFSLLQVFRKPLPSIFKEKIMDPIGASTTWRWYGYENSYVPMDGLIVQSVSGGGHFGGGMFINTLDMARFGLLFLRKGKWNGKQLISEKWVNDSHQSSVPSKSYGLMWWTNVESRLAGVPTGVYSAQGYGGNYIFIDNENDLVVVTRWLNDKKAGDFMSLVIEAVRK
jgi:CubicO group peptidase (beta-lactamase class C family)